jgi:hypothetical protein
MVDKFFDVIDPDNVIDKDIRMQYLGVWVLAWQACEREQPTVLSVDLAIGQMDEYRETIKKLTADLAKEKANLDHWLKIGQDRGKELQGVYKQIALKTKIVAQCAQTLPGQLPSMVTRRIAYF